MRTSLVAALIALAAAPSAHALAPNDFAWGWPITHIEGSGPHQITLPLEVHEVLQTEDQRDLQIFDASGSPIPMARYSPPVAEEAERRIGLATFALQRPASAAVVDTLLQVERGPDGSLRRIAADLGGGGSTRTRVDHLIDASDLEDPLGALELGWSASGDVRARFSVETSEDLEHWRTLVPGATVLTLQEGDATLEQRRIDLPAGARRYLLLRALDDQELGALQVEGIIEPMRIAPSLQWVEAKRVDSGNGGGFAFEAPGHFDVRKVRVVPQGERRLAEVQVRSVARGQRSERARFTVVQLRENGEVVSHDEATVAAATRGRRWEVISDPPLDVPPKLLLGARPDRFAFLPEGQGPWVLAAGSGDARHGFAPVQAAIDAIARREGRTWQPPEATLGARVELGGPSALVARPSSTMVLWGVLLAGAALVAALAVRLLRSGGAPQP